jgi:hypothetical protein
MHGSTTVYAMDPKARFLAAHTEAPKAEDRLRRRAFFRQAVTSGIDFDNNLRPTDPYVPPPTSLREIRPIYRAVMHGEQHPNAGPDLYSRPSPGAARFLRRRGYAGTEQGSGFSPLSIRVC